MESLLQLKRVTFTSRSTIGELSLNGEFQCYTLEDAVHLKKIKNLSAIPFGRYQVIIDMSTRFGRLMPHILNVPLFDGVRIHSGNTDKDTEGCVLVGKTRLMNWVGDSHLAFEPIFKKIQECLAQGSLWIEITGGFGAEEMLKATG